MDNEVKKLKKLINENLHNSKSEIRRVFGKPSKKSDNEVWFYRNFRFSLFNDEIVFVFKNDKVAEISLTRYFMWEEIKNIYYLEGQNPEYKVMNLLIPKNV